MTSYTHAPYEFPVGEHTDKKGRKAVVLYQCEDGLLIGYTQMPNGEHWSTQWRLTGECYTLTGEKPRPGFLLEDFALVRSKKLRFLSMQEAFEHMQRKTVFDPGSLPRLRIHSIDYSGHISLSTEGCPSEIMYGYESLTEAFDKFKIGVLDW